MPDFNLDQLAILLIESSHSPSERLPEALATETLGAGTTRANDVATGLVKLQETEFDAVIYVFGPEDQQAPQNVKLISSNCQCAVITITGASASLLLENQVLESGAQDHIDFDELTHRSLQRIVLSSMDRYILETRSREAKAEIDNRETLLQRIFDINSEAMLILAPTHQIRSYNPSAARLLDAENGSLVGETFPFAIDSDTDTELEIPESDGSSKPIRLSSIDVMWGGDPSKLIVLKDDTFKREANAKLEQNRAYLEATLDSIGNAVIMIDQNGDIIRLNRAAAAITGVDPSEGAGKALGKVLKLRHPETGLEIDDPMRDLVRPEFIEAYGKKGLPIDSVDYQRSSFVSIKMRSIHDEEGNPAGGVVALRDISRKFTSDNEMIANDPSSSIHVLAGGIAHDFNNLLAAILGNISIARVKIDPGSDLDQKLLSAENAAMQARSLSQQLLTFSKGGAPLLEVTTIGELVRESALFVIRGSNVKCDITEAEDLWSVDADTGQINQVVSNLAINADQAMTSGGLLKIDLSNEQVSSSDQVTDLQPGSYVKITFSDTGVGIAPNHLSRIFNPYFTTKKDGNGLGLASSYSIVKRHGGAITVESKVGEGSTFSVYLPKAESKESQTQASNAKPDREDSNKSEAVADEASGRILVMDDMEPMMLVAGEILTMLGYEVEYTSDGQEAVDAYKAAKESGNPFAAVVFDLTVPGGMGGEEASNILIEYDPDLIAIASSGYTTSNIMSDYEASAFKAVVPKPYRIQEMGDALKRALGS